MMGWRLGQLGGFARVGPRAPLVALIAANVPDLDVLLYAVDRNLGTWQHRGFTHSFFGIPLLAIGGAVLSHRRLRTGRFGDHLGLWAAALLSHVLMDWPTTWGTQLFWPLSDHRFGLEWIFIVDPAFWLLLGLLPLLLRRRGWTVGPAAGAGILCLGGWILSAGMLKEVAVARAPEPVAAYPAVGAPFAWTGVTPAVRTDPDVRRYWLTVLHAQRAGTFGRPAGPLVEAVLHDRVGERDLWMMVAPVECRECEDGTDSMLTLVDLAYTNWAYPAGFRFGHTYRVGEGGKVEFRSGVVALGGKVEGARSSLHPAGR